MVISLTKRRLTSVFFIGLAFQVESGFASGFDNLPIGSMDVIFDDTNFSFEAGHTYVNRNVKYKAKNARTKQDFTAGDLHLPGTYRPIVTTGPSSGVATPNVWNYAYNLKIRPINNIDCLFRVNNPGSILEEMPENWEGRFSFIKTELTTVGIDSTCAFKVNIREGMFVRAIAGARYIAAEIFNSKITGRGLAEASVKDTGYGWRVGASFEVPEYAIRAQIFYDSAIDLEMEGKLIVGLNEFDVISNVSMPQGVEMRVQSGIAPKWLAFVGVKWVNWSSLNELKLSTYPDDIAQVEATRTFDFTDGWTVTAGIGHQLTEKIQVGSSLTWDQGIGTSYSDTYSLGLGGAYQVNDNVKISLGGALVYKTGAKDRYHEGYSLNKLPEPFPTLEDYDDMDLSYDPSWNLGIGTKLKIQF